MPEINTDLEFVYKVADEFQKTKESHPALYANYNKLCEARGIIEDSAAIFKSYQYGTNLKVVNQMLKAATMMGEVQAWMLEVKGV